jgi:hypothetical protein
MSDLQNRIVGIVGRKGSGKSTRTSTLLKYAPRIFAWDPMADHRDLLVDYFERVDDELEDYLAEAFDSDTFACSYTAGDNLEGDFEEVCRLVYAYGELLFVVEEAPLVCRAGYLRRLHKWRLLDRSLDSRGLLLYRVNRRGLQRLAWLRAGGAASFGDRNTFRL